MPDIHHGIEIAAKPEAVYPLVATAHGFTQWWAEDVIETNGAVELGFFNRNTLYRLRLSLVQPPLIAEWYCETGKEWSGTQINFHLEPRGEKTFLRFTHAGWAADTEYFLSCNTAWGELIFRIKAAAEGKPRGPLFLRSTLAY